MADTLKIIVTTPVSLILLMAGLIFLFIAVVGNLAGKIEPGKNGRIAAAVFGFLLLLSSFVVTETVPIPSGNYQKSCKNSYIVGNTLHSIYGTGGTGGTGVLWNTTSLENFRDCKGIENRNGFLSCE